MPNLRDLEAIFVSYVGGRQEDVSFGRAEGVFYLCPTCFVANGNSAVGTHYIQTMWKDSAGPLWTVEGGDSLDNLTLAPSIHVIGGCEAHFFIRDGHIVFT